MKKILISFLIMTEVTVGCTRQDWLAKIYMVKAEEAFSKAHALRIQRIPYEKRLQYYHKACDYFLKAYQSDSRVFTLNRIETAADACLRVNDGESEKMFEAFRERYAKEHPTETEYGDAFPIVVE